MFWGAWWWQRSSATRLRNLDLLWRVTGRWEPGSVSSRERLAQVHMWENSETEIRNTQSQPRRTRIQDHLAHGRPPSPLPFCNPHLLIVPLTGERPTWLALLQGPRTHRLWRRGPSDDDDLTSPAGPVGRLWESSLGHTRAFNPGPGGGGLGGTTEWIMTWKLVLRCSGYSNATYGGD